MIVDSKITFFRVWSLNDVAAFHSKGKAIGIRNRLIINEMKKQVVGYMTIGLLAVAMMVQAQPASRPGRNLPLRDSIERMGPMNRMGTMGGPRMGAVRPGQVGQRDSLRGQAPMRRMDASRGMQGGMQGGMQRMPQGRNGMAPFGVRPLQRGGALAAPGNNRMQRGGAVTAPRNRSMERGGMAPEFGSRNMQRGMQGGMQPGMQRGIQRGMQPGLQSGRLVNPEDRIKAEVDQLDKALNLTPKQEKKITSIKKKQAKKEIKAYKKSQKRVDARQKKVQAPNDKIKSVLTDEQVKLYESSRSAVRIMR